jgi:hypothetical protein
MRWVAIILVFVASASYAKHCTDLRLQQAVIGGDTKAACACTISP